MILGIHHFKKPRGLLLKILQSRLWQRETPKLFQYDGIDGFGEAWHPKYLLRGVDWRLYGYGSLPIDTFLVG